jgi:hypothetical protein
VLEKHHWYANQWHARLQDVPVAERDQVLFMQASRWADDIRLMTGRRKFGLSRQFDIVVQRFVSPNLPMHLSYTSECWGQQWLLVWA